MFLFRSLNRVALLASSTSTPAQALLDLSQILIPDDCTCFDEGGVCFKPVCPLGYYKCCFDCEWASCFAGGDTFGSRKFEETMVLSLRGEKECLPCARGDYCPGCDAYQKCPGTQRLSYALRKVVETPKISYDRAGHERDCLECPSEGEADYLNDRCLPSPWRHACNETELSNCLLDGCDAGRHDGDECERLKCRMQCAKEQGPDCVKAFAELCEEMTNRPVDDAGRPVLPPEGSYGKVVAGGGTVVTTASTSTAGGNTNAFFSADMAIARIEPIPLDRKCDANCSAAARPRLECALLVGIVVYLSYSISLL